MERAVVEANQHSYQQIEELRLEAEDRRSQRQADRDTIRSLERRISSLAATPQLLTPDGPIRDTSPAPPKRKALPWPEKFEGDHNKFAAWAQQVKDKLRIDRALIGGYEA